MSKLKDTWIKGMNAIMLDCDKATLYAAKNEMNQLGCIKRMQLKMHLASCELCRTFIKQSQIISSQVKALKDIDDSEFKLHLSESQKGRLKLAINEQLARL